MKKRLAILFAACNLSLPVLSQDGYNEFVTTSLTNIEGKPITQSAASEASDGLNIASGGWVEIGEIVYEGVEIKPYQGYFFTVRFTGSTAHLTVDVKDPVSGWRNASADEHVPQEEGIWKSALFSSSSEQRAISLRLHADGGGIKLHDIKTVFITYHVSEDEVEPLGGAAGQDENNARGGGCSCPLPAYFTRAQYGVPNGGAQTCFPFVSAAPVTHLIVHHEGGGASQTSSNWAQRAFNIWNYHYNVSPENFCDVAYNWMLAPNGTLYEGRWGSATSNVRGAHMCGMCKLPLFPGQS